MNRKCLITGIAGMDGSNLAELLLSKGYEVHGTIRSSQTNSYSNIEKIKDKVKLFKGDLLDDTFLNSIDYSIYDEVYHLAAQSHVAVSFSIPTITMQVNFVVTVKLLNNYFTARDSITDDKSKSKFYFAGTSELFGRQAAPQSEMTPFDPISPYSQAKEKAVEVCRTFRDHGRFICVGLLFNHEHERRGKQFVTQKIIQAILEYKKDPTKNILVLGNYEAKRDWGYSEEYVQAMHMMLQHDTPDDYVVATNTTHTIKEFIVEALKQANITNYQILSNAIDQKLDYTELYSYEEMKIDFNTFYVVQSKDFFRPTEVNILQGDYSKIKSILGWEPKVFMPELISKMLKGNN